MSKEMKDKKFVYNNSTRLCLFRGLPQGLVQVILTVAYHNLPE